MQSKDEKQPTKYLYYQLDLENMPVDWDTTICESLDEVRDVLQYLDIHLDDDTIEAKITIRGIGMTEEAYLAWKKEHITDKPTNHE